jgi:hypothetical protein
MPQGKHVSKEVENSTDITNNQTRKGRKPGSKQISSNKFPGYRWEGVGKGTDKENKLPRVR